MEKTVLEEMDCNQVEEEITVTGRSQTRSLLLRVVFGEQFRD